MPPEPMAPCAPRRSSCLLPAALVIVGTLVIPAPGAAHPLGNFSISQYTAIRIEADRIMLRYVVDLAEIPTFQELQDAGLVPDPSDPRVRAYLGRKVATLRDGLLLELDGRRLGLETESTDVIFPPGVGGLPTMKMGALFRAALPAPRSPGPERLDYRDRNFPDRVGWKEIIGVAAPGVTLASSTVPARGRSQELADYPTDLLNSPPQDLEARVAFARESASPSVASIRPATPGADDGAPRPPDPDARRAPAPAAPPAPGDPRAPGLVASPPAVGDPQPGGPAPPRPPAAAGVPGAPAPDPRSVGGGLDLRPNRQAPSRGALSDLMARNEMGAGFVALALLVAASLGAFHALEPGHGKTVVAAYLVGSRGTVWHALWLGLIVTGAHTAGVYLLGVVTLYASRYVVPERLYPWLGVVSGLIIAGLGFTLFLRRYAAPAGPHGHGHGHRHPHEPEHGHAHEPAHGPEHGHSHVPPTDATGRVSVSALVALGVGGGIIPCPAALVVLLTAVSLNRIGFGFLLIVAFSVGLAAVLVAIGVLMVQARRVMARFGEGGPLIQRWLPLTSSAVMTLLGIGIAIQALVAAGILQIRL